MSWRAAMERSCATCALLFVIALSSIHYQAIISGKGLGGPAPVASAAKGGSAPAAAAAAPAKKEEEEEEEEDMGFGLFD